MVTDLRYPIGKFYKNTKVSDLMISQLISDLEALPIVLINEVRDLTTEQLETKYRPGGWTVRQVVHHLPDSHLQAYVRFKLALTEENPGIKTYREDLWAELKDTFNTPLDVSLQLLSNLHTRWVILLSSMTPDEFDKTLYHPEWDKITLRTTLALYSWHGKHHVAHITNLKQRMGW